MTAPTTIRSASLARLDIPLHAPFGISGGAQAMANNVLFAVELADGTRGHGEAAPLPPYNGETQAGALAALGPTARWLPGRDAADWHALAAEFRARGGAGCGAAQCAFETALLDALTRSRGEPLWKFVGRLAGHDDAAPADLETDMTITTGSPEEAARAADAIQRRGIRTLKIKIGGEAGPAHDLARIAAVRGVAPDAPLVLDGNAGISRGAARALVHGLRERNIAPALLEQWLEKTDLAGARALREETGWPVAADEAVATPAEAQRVVDAKAADVINIKLMKAGIATALEIAALARAHGVALMIGGNVESLLGMTASACFAAGLGGFRFADLDTPLFMAANPFAGGFELHGGRISLAAIRAGHGVVPR